MCSCERRAITVEPKPLSLLLSFCGIHGAIGVMEWAKRQGASGVGVCGYALGMCWPLWGRAEVPRDGPREREAEGIRKEMEQGGGLASWPHGSYAHKRRAYLVCSDGSAPHRRLGNSQIGPLRFLAGCSCTRGDTGLWPIGPHMTRPE